MIKNLEFLQNMDLYLTIPLFLGLGLSWILSYRNLRLLKKAPKLENFLKELRAEVEQAKMILEDIRAAKGNAQKCLTTLHDKTNLLMTDCSVFIDKGEAIVEKLNDHIVASKKEPAQVLTPFPTDPKKRMTANLRQIFE